MDKKDLEGTRAMGLPRPKYDPHHPTPALTDGMILGSNELPSPVQTPLSNRICGLKAAELEHRKAVPGNYFASAGGLCALLESLYSNTGYAILRKKEKTLSNGLCGFDAASLRRGWYLKGDGTLQLTFYGLDTELGLVKA
ncbi:hypothetical protein BKA70DRAFT_1225319 [Coprinopsis sp. MPI-PUGE-AT-0042]|nr:hypothetical protein BKA70DRAFT_1225319 [Coprinopsis sp. MPI-PUGE-AT-0042]